MLVLNVVGRPPKFHEEPPVVETMKEAGLLQFLVLGRGTNPGRRSYGLEMRRGESSKC